MLTVFYIGLLISKSNTTLYTTTAVKVCQAVLILKLTSSPEHDSIVCLNSTNTYTENTVTIKH